MNKKFASVLLTATMILSQAALAQNRDDSDTAFPEAKVGEGTQILLGLGDLIGATVFSQMRNGTSHADDIEELQESIRDNKAELAKASSKQPKRVKLAAEIKDAERKIAELRKAAIDSVATAAKLSKAMKVVTIVGQTVLIVDVIGRIYVWNAMDRNPTLSPVATYIMHNGAKLMSN